MSLFDWKDEYSVNIKEIDKQHKRLVDALNDLWKAMRDGEAREVIGHTLKGLLEYTKVHFTYEEDLMKKYNYPGLADQIKSHNAFVQKITEYNDKYKQGKLMLSLEVMNFMKDWLQKHIMGTDKQYTGFFNEKGVH